MTVPPANRPPIASYSWGGFGSQNDITQFRQVFQPDQGIFSPGYPLVSPERERVRVWDFPVGYNTIYTPRAYDPIGFAELRALAEHHDVTRLAIETRKDQIEKLEWSIRARTDRRPNEDASARISALTEFWRKPDGEQPFGTWLRELLEDLLVLDAPCLEVRGAGIDDRELANAAAGFFEPLPVQIPHHPAGRSAASAAIASSPLTVSSRDLKVRALAAEALEQERRVRDRELVPPVRGGHRAVGDVGQFSELLWHPARQVPDAAAEASTPTRVNRPQTRLSAPRPTTRTGRSRFGPEPATPPRAGARLPHPRVRARACATNRMRTAPRRTATASAASLHARPRSSAPSRRRPGGSPCSTHKRHPCRYAVLSDTLGGDGEGVQRHAGW